MNKRDFIQVISGLLLLSVFIAWTMLDIQGLTKENRKLEARIEKLENFAVFRAITKDEVKWLLEGDAIFMEGTSTILWIHGRGIGPVTIKGKDIVGIVDKEPE